MLIASEIGDFMQQGEILVWTNENKEEIIIMVTNRENTGVVIHSDGVVDIGTLVSLDGVKMSSFIGTINILCEETTCS
jgi:hypothetical protein